MEKFTKLESIAAYLPIINIDTDMIIPKQFLKTIKRTGLGKSLFYEMRYDDNNNPIDDFILNIKPFDKSKILISGANFGCGSSREHAPWSLLDFGIRCIIAPSFADIFYNNCFKNGILPITLSEKIVSEIGQYAQKSNNSFIIDLEKQTIEYDNKSISFEIDQYRKKCLVEGLDDIALTLLKEDKISEFERKNKVITPWLYNQ